MSGVSSVVLAAVLLGVVDRAEASTFAGRNGVLLASQLDASPFLTSSPPGVMSRANRDPVARPADCMGTSWLWSVFPDGTHVRYLGVGDSALFAPSGRRLAIDFETSCYGDGGPTGLYLAAANGTHRRHIPGNSLVGWLPSGRLIVSDEVGGTGPQRLLDALSQRVLMTLPFYWDSDSSTNVAPIALSCAGRAASVRETRLGDELNVFTPTGSSHAVARRTVAVARRGIRDWGWAPDGRSLLFAADDGRHSPGLWRVSLDARRPRQLTRPGTGYVDSAPRWSPRGDRILFLRTGSVRGKPFVQDAMVMKADGSRQHVIAAFPTGEPVDQGLWAPDDTSVAFPDALLGRSSAPEIINATTGAVIHQMPFVKPTYGWLPLLDWQPLPDGHPVRCHDRQRLRTFPTSAFTG